MTDGLAHAIEILGTRAHGLVEPRGAIAPYTSYRLGGPAGVLFHAGAESDLEALSAAIAASGVPFLVVGRGSNMLVSDRGFDGIVVRLGGAFRWARAEAESVEAGAAMPVPAMASLALQHELAGFEFAVAIPGSFGGAIRMNAGAHGREVRDVLERARVWLVDRAEAREIDAGEAGFAYRSSALPPASIVVAGRLRLQRGEGVAIRARMDEAREWRRTTQPVSLPNGGSVFKNPPGDHAARLIETVCGKGMRVGGASISEVHANFIVAEEGARAADVYTLMRKIQRMVSDNAGVELEPELKLVGDFDEVPA